MHLLRLPHLLKARNHCRTQDLLCLPAISACAASDTPIEYSSHCTAFMCPLWVPTLHYAFGRAGKLWRSQAISLDGLLDYEEDDREVRTILCDPPCGSAR